MVVFEEVDALFWKGIFIDHCQFLFGLTTDNRFRQLCVELESEWKYWKRGDKEYEKLVLRMTDLTVQAIDYKPIISDNDYVDLLTHMTEETGFVLKLLRRDITDEDVKDFWHDNFREHFTLLADTWPTKDMTDKHEMEMAIGLIDQRTHRGYSLACKILHRILQSLRHFSPNLDLLTYKMAQHEYKEMKYGIEQIKTINL
jgi:hypothetical protein